MEEYFEYCETLYDDWSSSDLRNSKWADEELWQVLKRHKVEAGFSPEPYLAFGGLSVLENWKKTREPALIFVTTNPGKGDVSQKIGKAASFPTYDELQKRFTTCEYRPEEKGEHRNEKDRCR